MARVGQIQGMLLEEAMLYLLRYCGYRPVTTAGQDPTLKSGRSGLEVKGRGENHQIDAIADFTIPQPFCNPPRLLVEAKFKSTAVGLDIVRNAVGVLKDVSEYWATGRETTTLPRYHYQYAILASSGYTKPAQQYAIAQDVYLISFAKGGFFEPVLAAIRDIGVEQREGQRALAAPIRLSKLRNDLRSRLEQDWNALAEDFDDWPAELDLSPVIRAIRQTRFVVLATALDRLPLVLTPAPGVEINRLREDEHVRIRWDARGWYLVSANDPHQRLFSFDLPETLFRRYAEQGRLTPTGAIDMKEEALSQIDALFVHDGQTRLLRFHLDPRWVRQVRDRLRRAP